MADERRHLSIALPIGSNAWGAACCGEGAETVLATPAGAAIVPGCYFLDLGYRRSRCRLFDVDLYVEHFDDGDGSDPRPSRCPSCLAADARERTETASRYEKWSSTAADGRNRDALLTLAGHHLTVADELTKKARAYLAQEGEP